MNFCTMPVAGGSYYQARYKRDYAFVYPIQSQLLTIINESLNPYVEQVTIRQLDLMSVNADGSLRSSTGVLADPSLAQVPVRESPEPVESDPVESDPIESGPVESDPIESRPVESNPPVRPSREPEPSETPGRGDDSD